MSDYKAAFFIVPARIMALPNLTLAYLKIYETIFQFWNANSVCYLSNDKIHERTGISSHSTLMQAFAFFEKHGEMKRITKGSKRYIIQPTRAVEIEEEPVDKSIENSTNNSQGVAKSTGGGRNSDPLGVGIATHNNNNINNNNLNKSFYKDLGKKNTSEERHDFAAMKNESASIAENENFKHCRMPENLKSLYKRRKNEQTSSDAENHKKALQLLAQRLGKTDELNH